MRRFTLILAGLQTLFALTIVIAGSMGAIPFAKGYSGIAAVLATLVWTLFSGPALLLAATDRAPNLALLLAIVGGLLMSYDGILRLDTAFDAVPFSGLLALGVFLGFGGLLYLSLAKRQRPDG